MEIIRLVAVRVVAQVREKSPSSRSFGMLVTMGLRAMMAPASAGSGRAHRLW